MRLSAFSTSTYILLAREKPHNCIVKIQYKFIISNLHWALKYSFIVPLQLFFSFPFINITNHHNSLKSLTQSTSSRLLTDHIFWQLQGTEVIRQDLIQLPITFTTNPYSQPMKCALLHDEVSFSCLRLTHPSGIWLHALHQFHSLTNFQISPCWFLPFSLWPCLHLSHL